MAERSRAGRPLLLHRDDDLVAARGFDEGRSAKAVIERLHHAGIDRQGVVVLLGKIVGLVDEAAMLDGQQLVGSGVVAIPALVDHLPLHVVERIGGQPFRVRRAGIDERSALRAGAQGHVVKDRVPCLGQEGRLVNLVENGG